MTRNPIILGDWGSSHLRLWLVDEGTIIERSVAPGLFAAKVSPATSLQQALAGLAHGQPDTDILLCGMAGARAGLCEVGYLACPATIAQLAGASVRADFASGKVRILPGLKGRDARGRPEVMRGEETQVFGAIGLRPSLAHGHHRLVLPGTHSKWVDLSDGVISGFATAPTGEMWNSLIGTSLAGTDVPGTDDPRSIAEGFDAGVDRIVGGAGLPDSLFEARAAQMLDGRTPAWSRGFLSGLLIAAEIAAMTKTGGDSPPILVGDPRRCSDYRRAFGAFDCYPAVMDGEECVLKGMELAYAYSG